jgi:hypothetical protein
MTYKNETYEILWKLNFITIWVLNLVTEFEQKIENKIIYGSENTQWLRTALCPGDVDLKNGSRREGENTPVTQQGKTWSTKARQDLPINMVINNWLLTYKAIGEQLYLYVKFTLRVSPYFHILAIFKSLKPKLPSTLIKQELQPSNYTKA